MSAADPRVSVIMATYNEQAFVAEAIESVLAQGFGDCEVIVSDDGSTDSTAEIAEAFAAREPERIKVLRGEQNQGKPFALNRGARDRTRRADRVAGRRRRDAAGQSSSARSPRFTQIPGRPGVRTTRRSSTPTATRRSGASRGS